jgi:hypothetical protein
MEQPPSMVVRTGKVREISLTAVIGDKPIGA